MEGDKLGIGTNPPSSTLLTYHTNYRGGSLSPSRSSPGTYDNRFIYLNGLSIKVVEQLANGDVKIKIQWDDFTVSEDRRWCGDIILKDTVYLASGITISLDQGLTPTKPVHPITFEGDKIFADPTKLTCKNNSLFELESGSFVDVANNSALILESGSELTIEDGSILHVQESVYCMRTSEVFEGL